MTFHAATNRSDNQLHIETDGCVVNLRVGLTDIEGRPITRVDVLPDSEYRGGDGVGNFWDVIPGDDPGVSRVVRYRDSERFADGKAPVTPVLWKLTRRDVEAIAGRAVTDEEAALIEGTLHHSDLAEVIADAVAQVCGAPKED